MTATTELEQLTALAKRLEGERRRLVELLATAADGQAPDAALLRQLSDVQGACMGVAAEIEARTPTIGRGGET
jgi:hypothetical protein